MAEKAVVDAAKQIASGQGEEQIVTLSTGVCVRLHPVSSSLVEEMKATIPMPPVPVVYIEAKDREEENPNDPRYIDAVEEVTRRRGEAILDALLIFGVELVDGLPEDKTWLEKLRFLERRSSLNLSDFDLDDDFDLEFLFKKYVAVAGTDLSVISGLHGFRPMEVARARATFLDHAPGDSGRRVRTEEHGQDGDRDE